MYFLWLLDTFASGFCTFNHKLEFCLENWAFSCAKFGVYIWFDFSIFFSNWNQNWLTFKKILEKSVLFLKIGPIERMGHFFLKNWYLHGFTFKFLGGTSLPNQTWVTPHPAPLWCWKKDCLLLTKIKANTVNTCMLCGLFWEHVEYDERKSQFYPF